MNDHRREIILGLKLENLMSEIKNAFASCIDDREKKIMAVKIASFIEVPLLVRSREKKGFFTAYRQALMNENRLGVEKIDKINNEDHPVH